MNEFMVGIGIGGMAASFILGLVALDEPEYLKRAQRSYTECISLQAPREECLKKYLLPEDK